MTGILVLAILVLAVVAALEYSHRRNRDATTTRLAGSWVADDRDAARTKLDLVAASTPTFATSPATSVTATEPSDRSPSLVSTASTSSGRHDSSKHAPARWHAA